MTKAKQRGPLGCNMTYYTPAEPNVYRPKSYYNSRTCTGAKELTKKDLMMGIKFGAFRWDKLSFERAVVIVEGYLNAETKACHRLVKQINEDHWLTSFWSEVFGKAKPPSHKDWIKPHYSLMSARSAYRAGKLRIARSYFEYAIAQYNAVHKKWVTYRDRLDAGAQTSITIIEFTIVVLSTAVGGHLGAGRSLLAKGAISAGMSAGTVTAKEAGKVLQGVEKKMDFFTIVTESFTSFLTSIIGGKLSQKFIDSIQPEFWRKIFADPKLIEAYRRSNIMLPKPETLKLYFADFLTTASVGVIGEILKNAVSNAARKAKGKEMKMADFLSLVAKEVAKDRIGKHFGDYVAKLALAGKR